MKQILNDPKKLQEEMALVQRNLAALQNAEQAMRNPHKRQQVPGRCRLVHWPFGTCGSHAVSMFRDVDTEIAQHSNGTFREIEQSRLRAFV